MFIAMNRFRVKLGQEAAFEEVWAKRESYLDKSPGFRVFHLLRGPQREDHTLYSSHTIWETKGDFEAWTKSDAFRQAHKNAGSQRDLYLGPPEFEGFEAVQEYAAA